MTKNTFVAQTFNFIESLAKVLDLKDEPQIQNVPAEASTRMNITDFHPSWDEKRGGVLVPLINLVIDPMNFVEVDEVGEQQVEFNWDDAMKLVKESGKRLMSKSESRIVAYFLDEINALLEAHGGQKLSGWYWTCDEYIPEDKKSSSEYSASNAWYVNFDNGNVNNFSKYYDSYVRAVAAI